jgi:hypothetical protein
MAIAFLAKSVFNLLTTRVLFDRLQGDIIPHCLCGWKIPSVSAFF